MGGEKKPAADKPREPGPKGTEKTVTRPPNKMVGPGGYKTK